MDRVVFRIKGQQQLVEPAKLFLRYAAAFLQRTGEHQLGAAADQAFDMSDGDGQEAAGLQRVIDRRAQILMRVEQGAVEIETNSVEVEKRHVPI